MRPERTCGADNPSQLGQDGSKGRYARVLNHDDLAVRAFLPEADHVLDCLDDTQLPFG